MRQLICVIIAILILFTLIYLHVWLLSYIKILIRLGILTYTLDLYLYQNKVN
jgi:hypothetical protein